MAATHHTPGPWRIRMDNAAPPEPLRITCDERGVIAELAYTGLPEEADAHLIAAAPDLLTAAKALWDAVVYDAPPETLTAALNAVEAAVEKAEA